MNEIKFVDKENYDESYYRLHFDIVVSEGDKCCYDLDEYDKIDSGDKILTISARLPRDFFEPLRIEVEIPEEILAPQKGIVSSVEIPISIDEDLENITIKESIKSSNGLLKNGIIGMLKRAIEFLDKEEDEK